jgi:Uma2 family endonuclease
MEFAQLDLNKIYSYADYYKWKFEDRVELIKGRIFKMSPSPASAHQVIQREISGQLWQFLKGKKCQVFSAPLNVRFPGKSIEDKDILTVLQPDLFVVCDPDKIDKKGCLGALDIVIEILSPLNSKKELKFRYAVYVESAVKEYWVVFPDEKTLLIYILTNGKFIPSRLMVKSNIVTSEILPGLKLELSEIFPAYDYE